MSRTAPEWLDNDFFTKVIRHFTNDEEAILHNFTVRSGSKAGESFASNLYRVNISYATSCEVKTISVIVKSLPACDSGEIDGQRMFLTEMKMYGESLVKIREIIHNAYDGLNFFPT
jgi:hypothetical protein